MKGKTKATLRKEASRHLGPATPGASFAFFLWANTDLFVFRKGRINSLPTSQGGAACSLLSGDGEGEKEEAGGPTTGSVRAWEAGLLGTAPSGLGEPEQQRPRSQQVPWDQTIRATFSRRVLLERRGNLHSVQEHLKADPKQRAC